MSSVHRIKFLVHRLNERLWVRPLAVCALSIVAAFAAGLADNTSLAPFLPVIARDAVETLLSVMASGMLVIATFAVASMVSAYASAGRSATPRSFPLLIAYDSSQNALSTFVGSFIFSIVALTAVKNSYFERAGVFIVFVMTLTVFGIVIVTFVRWVDRIARLGRIGPTIDAVEEATAKALKRRRNAPTLHGVPARPGIRSRAVTTKSVGYVQSIDMAALQEFAEGANLRLEVAALPGTFVSPDRALAYILLPTDGQSAVDCDRLVKSLQIGGDRLFEDDPRFGLVVLSEIASRALSPAVNDPGTVIDVVGTLLRLFVLWLEPASSADDDNSKFDRVEVPELSVRDMFDDAFTAIARDGAGMVEVSVRLQKALRSLASLGDDQMRIAAEFHSKLALKRSQHALTVEEDLRAVQDAFRSETPAGS